MGDRLGIQGAVGFIFTLLTVTVALILPGYEPTAPCIPSWSPMQVLIRAPTLVELPKTDELRHVHQVVYGRTPRWWHTSSAVPSSARKSSNVQGSVSELEVGDVAWEYMRCSRLSFLGLLTVTGATAPCIARPGHPLPGPG